MSANKNQPSSRASVDVVAPGLVEMEPYSSQKRADIEARVHRYNLDPFVVTFEGSADIANPFNWSRTYKWCLIGLISAMTLVVNLATLMCAPAALLILAEFNSDNQLYATILVSIWEFGEALGPLLIAPLSEIYGRAPIYHTANVLFVVFSVIGALSTNLHMLVAFRFLTGISVASVTLNPSIVGDLFVVEERGSAMSIMGLAPLLGPVTGPIIGGYISQGIGWRWTFWLAAIAAGSLEIGFVVLFRETYKVRILHQKAARLRKETGNHAFRPAYDGIITGTAFLRKAIIRPAQMLCLSTAIFLLAIYVAVVFGYLYLLLTSITAVFQRTYDFSTGSASLTFLGIGIGMATGMLLCKATLDRYVKMTKDLGGVKPEHRLPPMVFGGLVIPLSLFLYGWTAQNGLHWILPVIGIGILGFGVAVTIIPTFSYLVDAFGIHAASAVAANISLRCITGAVLPLAGPPLYGKLGLGWGNSVLGFIALVFVPLPLILMRYGEKIRESSKLRITF